MTIAVVVASQHNTQEGGHLRIGQRICANNDGQRVAEQRSRREHVDQLKREVGHDSAPGLIGRARQKHKEPLFANRFALIQRQPAIVHHCDDFLASGRIVMVVAISPQRAAVRGIVP